MAKVRASLRALEFGLGSQKQKKVCLFTWLLLLLLPLVCCFIFRIPFFLSFFLASILCIRRQNKLIKLVSRGTQIETSATMQIRNCCTGKHRDTETEIHWQTVRACSGSSSCTLVVHSHTNTIKIKTTTRTLSASARRTFIVCLHASLTSRVRSSSSSLLTNACNFCCTPASFSLKHTHILCRRKWKLKWVSSFDLASAAAAAAAVASCTCTCCPRRH